ncbi:alpha/beta hydrolase fold domain-containing protein [Aquimarina mytili]|uniref:Alpha/beta hydrolase fold domain-containing protein n=1 Tax=Aquimarina mytili TaxID=874423 RepID=A0A937D9W7_9FLAO|nr:alpha/beta hydrolase [Aquimarina mytili]MBL0682963.1 alpha/beta hydrolase fold domain-containing protein [Aquimarina mytili]
MSFGYSLVKLVLKLKGEKHSWSKDPIDYKKKRKQNILRPGKWLLSGSILYTKKVGETSITSITPKNENTDILFFYCHGGAFVYGPTRENWIALSKIAKGAKATAWMIDYPKAPEYKIKEVTENVFNAYLEAIKEFDPNKIILIGDSAGGNLILTLTQRLIKENIDLPNRLIPISPLIDASLTNPKIKEIDVLDPILSYNGVISAKRMLLEDIPLTDSIISPINGSLRNFPPIHMFSAELDIFTPDQELFTNKAKKEGVEIEVIVGQNMPHVWPILPIMSEAKAAIDKIISIANAI